MKFNYLSPPYFLVVVILILIIITAATATTVVDVHAEAEVEDYDDEAVEADDDNDAAYDDGAVDEDWLMSNNISLIIHRNGEIDPCGVTRSITKEFTKNLLPSKLNKYEIESRLTDNIFKTIITTTNDGDKKNNMDLCGPGSSNGSSNSNGNINDDDDDDEDDNEYDDDDDDVDDDDSHTDDSLFEGIDDDDDDDSYKNKEEEDEKVVVNAAKAKAKKKSSSLSTSSSSFYKHCDRGTEYTPILLDYNKLVKTNNSKTGSLPCRFYTREGLRITSLKQLTNLIITEQQSKQQSKELKLQQSCNATANPQDDGSSSSSSSSECNNNNNDDELSDNNTNNTNTFQFHLYAVPAGRVFIFAPSHVDEIFELNHMQLLPNINKPISLKVLSVNPKIFDIINVFTKDEASLIVQRALNEKSPSHKIKRSTTGNTGINSIIQKRTSENAFDTHSKVALDLKKRIFELLGFDEYWNGHDDGLQVLRYNMTTAYIPHMDYISSSTKSIFDYRSQLKGGNRYATVLLYMTDIPENGGGETVFSKAWPSTNIVPIDERKSHSDALNELRQSGDADRAGIKQDSWEERMVATCRSRMSVRPHSGRAVLFYSQLPNGQQDTMSTHGGCPVLEGDKWAANLWVWNTPRQDYDGSPVRQDLIDAGFIEKVDASSSASQKIKAIFKNSGKDPNMINAVLYYDEAMYWGKLGFNDPPLHSNTFEGHKWNVKVNDIIVKSWVISKSKEQEFII